MKPLHIVLMVAALTTVLLLSREDGHAGIASLQASTEGPVPVDMMPVPDLPVSISQATLQKTEQGYVLKCSAANSSSDQILGATFFTLVLDSENKVLSAATWTARLQLASYATQEISLKSPLKMPGKGRYRVVITLEQLVGRESIWQVMNARESMENYARGEDYKMPQVRKVSNQFDPPAAALR